MAVQTVTGNVQASISYTETGAQIFSSAVPFPASIPTSSTNFNYVNATGGALSINTIHAKQYTLAATTLAINLFDGSLLSPSGAACVFGRVREFFVGVVDTTSTHLLKVYSTASPAGVLWLPPVANYLWCTPNGGSVRLQDPNSITTAGFLVDTTNKGITFDAGAFTIIFNLLIVGNSSAA